MLEGNSLASFGNEGSFAIQLVSNWSDEEMSVPSRASMFHAAVSLLTTHLKMKNTAP